MAEKSNMLVGEVVIGVGTYSEELFLADVLGIILDKMLKVNIKIFTGNSLDFAKDLYGKKSTFLLARKAGSKMIAILFVFHCIQMILVTFFVTGDIQFFQKEKLA